LRAKQVPRAEPARGRRRKQHERSTKNL